MSWLSDAGTASTKVCRPAAPPAWASQTCSASRMASAPSASAGRLAARAVSSVAMAKAWAACCDWAWSSQLRRVPGRPAGSVAVFMGELRQVVAVAVSVAVAVATRVVPRMTRMAEPCRSMRMG